MNKTPTHEDIIAALKEAGYAPQRDGCLITLEFPAKLGISREYIIEPSGAHWSVTRKEINVMKGDDEPEEEDTNLGSFGTATKVATAVKDAQFSW